MAATTTEETTADTGKIGIAMIVEETGDTEGETGVIRMAIAQAIATTTTVGEVEIDLMTVDAGMTFGAIDRPTGEAAGTIAAAVVLEAGHPRAAETTAETTEEAEGTPEVLPEGATTMTGVITEEAVDTRTISAVVLLRCRTAAETIAEETIVGIAVKHDLYYFVECLYGRGLRETRSQSLSFL